MKKVDASRIDDDNDGDDNDPLRTKVIIDDKSEQCSCGEWYDNFIGVL